MKDEKRWNLGLSKLHGFEENLPASIDEECVNHYHAIVAILEEASGEDLSQFKISPDRVKPRIVSVTPGSHYGGPSRVQYSDRRYCDGDHFKSQLAGLLKYLPLLQRGAASGTSRYHSLSDNELMGKLFVRRIPPKLVIERGEERYIYDRKHAIDALSRADENVGAGTPPSTVFNVGGQISFTIAREPRSREMSISKATTSAPSSIR